MVLHVGVWFSAASSVTKYTDTGGNLETFYWLLLEPEHTNNHGHRYVPHLYFCHTSDVGPTERCFTNNPFIKFKQVVPSTYPRLYNTKIKVVKPFGLKCIEVLDTLMNHHAKGLFI